MPCSTAKKKKKKNFFKKVNKEINASQPGSITSHFNPSPASFPSASCSIHWSHPPSASPAQNQICHFISLLLLLDLYDLWKRKSIYIWTNGCLYECIIPISPNSWTLKLCLSHEPLQAFEIFWREFVWYKEEKRGCCLLWVVGDKQLPRQCSGKASICQCRRCKRCEFDPWMGKIPWRRAWQSTPVSLPGESHGQRSLADCSP